MKRKANVGAFWCRYRTLVRYIVPAEVPGTTLCCIVSAGTKSGPRSAGGRSAMDGRLGGGGGGGRTGASSPCCCWPCCCWPSCWLWWGRRPTCCWPCCWGWSTAKGSSGQQTPGTKRDLKQMEPRSWTRSASSRGQSCMRQASLYSPKIAPNNLFSNLDVSTMSGSSCRGATRGCTWLKTSKWWFYRKLIKADDTWREPCRPVSELLFFSPITAPPIVLKPCKDSLLQIWIEAQ